MSTSTTRTGDWIQVYSGGQFYPLDPRPEEIHIKDIAHALSNLCRFAGHVKTFYSVAEHSVRVSLACDPADALWGLLHDASEAYLVDIPRPLKRSGIMQNYIDVERGVMAAICQRFNLPLEQPASVTRADNTLLATEARDLMSPLHPEWRDRYEPLPERIFPYSPSLAREWFANRFYELTGEIV